MALTPSTMLALGTTAPGFSLPEPATGNTFSLASFSGAPALLVAFLCNHCPYVQHLRGALAQFEGEYRARGLAFVAINSNDVERYPADSPEKMIQEVRRSGWHFPYLFDADQSVAKAYRAACTPDFFLFDKERKLVYRGQFDGSRPGNGKPINGNDLRLAVDAVLSGRPVPGQQFPSMGCNIKWKPGREPDYFG